MKKVFSVLLALLVTAPVLAQSWGPLTLPQPTAADDLKYVQWNATTRRYQLSTVAVSADNVIGNEVTNATDATLTRSGSGTAGSPYTLGLTLSNANTWTAAISVLRAGITTTLTEAVALTNTTASTVGVPVQQSPALRLEGHAWDTDGSDDKWDWYLDQLPATAATTSSTFRLQAAKNGAAASTIFSASSGGGIKSSGVAPLSAGALTLGFGSASTTGHNWIDINPQIRTVVSAYGIYLNGFFGNNTANMDGTYAGMYINNIWNLATATSEGPSTDLLINRTETNLSTGPQALIDAKVGGTSKFTVSNTGATKVTTLQLTNTAEPTCDATTRGMVVYVAGGAGVADTLRVCRKDAGDVYAWTALY